MMPTPRVTGQVLSSTTNRQSGFVGSLRAKDVGNPRWCPSPLIPVAAGFR